ncbi:glycoside hydrolase family 3 protein [Demequina zhanjiangensis]|uniref:Glycoside hydrolase family 3 N-terminal domain-containing protein n=1 Tax=Demequina zhanjiangensis TaxID=3051659 RepID=A0ABT8FXI0_9MICO|nr:glycoside hydrolase family 3 N-terminal domain-containing protein [Demequina sp. SYSU T00b26]MDN4471611.1 glycoside hydrolase family 3 N-terminal domain-containing protein [Demequina sp. SYSU T00b26]
MNALTVLMPGFDGTTLPSWLEQRLRDGLGGVCLFGTNVSSPEQLRELTQAIHAANPHAIIAIDEEGGDVSRLYQAEGSPFPGNAVLGRLDDLALTERVGAQVGWELRAAGVDLTMAPDVDVNSNPLNPVIGVRSFGVDAGKVGEHGAAWIRGVQSTGVAACAKHFPGHGDTAQDSHVSLPTVTADADTVRTRELAPFAAAIDAGSATLMSSHILVPALDATAPTTFSRPILRDLLRDAMGFDGVVISDALDMAGASGGRGIAAAAVLAIHGGCDFLCFGTRNSDAQVEEILTAFEEAIADGELAAEDLEKAAERVSALGASLAAVRAGRPVPGDMVSGEVPGLDAALASRAVEVSDEAVAALRSSRQVVWVQLEPSANIAVGVSPWGPFAVGVSPVAVLGPEGDPADALAAVPEGALVLVVGKDNHRHAFARAAIDAFRASGPTIAVDMGWPDPDAGYADVSTVGASRLMGSALVQAVTP